MRTLVDIDNHAIAALNDYARQQKRSRASVIREAIARYLATLQKSDGQAFGVWNKAPHKPVDGVALQRKLRAEW